MTCSVTACSMGKLLTTLSWTGDGKLPLPSENGIQILGISYDNSSPNSADHIQ